MIALYASLGVSNLCLLLSHCVVELLNFALDVLDAGGETCNVVFQVLNLERKLTSQLTILVNA